MTLPRTSHRLALGAALAACLFITSPAAGQTRSWVGLGGSQYWYGPPTNWSPIGLPLSNDSVRIGDLAGQQNADVLLVGAAEVANLTLFENAELSLTGPPLDYGELHVSGTIRLNGTSRLISQGGPADADVSANRIVLADASMLRATSGRIEVRELLTIDDNATLQSGGFPIEIDIVNDPATSGRVLNNNGAIIIVNNSGNVLRAGNGGTLDLDGSQESGRLELPSSLNTWFTIDSPLTDDFNGSMLIETNTRLTMTHPWSAGVGGIIDLAGGEIAGAPFTSSATINVNPSEGGFSQSRITTNAVFNGGGINVDGDGGSVLNFMSTASFSGATTLHSDGTIYFEASTVFNGVDLTGTGSLAVVDSLTIQGDVDLAGGRLFFGPAGMSASAAMTIAGGASLGLDFRSMDPAETNVYEGLLSMNGGALDVNFDNDGWTMAGVATFTGNNSIAGDTVYFTGDVNVVDGTQSIAAHTAFLAGGDVSINPGAMLSLTGPSHVVSGGAVHGDGALRLANMVYIGSDVDVGALEIVAGSDVEISFGQVRVDNLSKDAAGNLSIIGGSLTVDGGTASFNSAFSFGGSQPTAPFVRIENGADAVVTSSWRMGLAAGESASTIVVGTGGGRRSTLRGTVGGGGADLVVGVNGNGTLLVNAGGLVDFGDDFIVGQNAGSHGQATVTGVLDGFRSTVDVTGGSGSSVQIGGGDGGGPSIGVLEISNGALVRTSSDVMLARFSGSLAFLTVGNMAGGFVAELDAADDLFVGGTATAAGGDATLTLNNGGVVRGDEMIVWGGGTVAMNGGEMFLDTLDLATGGGDFQLSGGVLHVGTVEGSLVNDGGTLSPGGSPGLTEVIGDYTHGENASLFIELAGLTPVKDHDVFSVTGGVSLDGGKLDVVLDGGFTPAEGDAFDILNFGSLRGVFDVINLPSLPGLLQWDASGLYETGVLSVFNGEKSVDFDNDGDIDGDDLGVWTKSFSEDDLADADADGDSDGNDFLAWQQKVGSLPAAPRAGAVPEPAALTILVTGFVVMGARRCRTFDRVVSPSRVP